MRLARYCDIEISKLVNLARHLLAPYDNKDILFRKDFLRDSLAVHC